MGPTLWNIDQILLMSLVKSFELKKDWVSLGISEYFQSKVKRFR